MTKTQTMPRVEMPQNLSAEEQIEWLATWITDRTGQEAPSCMPQKGLKEGEGAIEAVIRMVLERSDEIDRLRHVVSLLDREAAMVYREAKKGHVVMPCPVIECPVCGAPDIDMDGFGCLACPRDPTLCYCSHPSVTDGICGICQDPESRCEGDWDMHNDINDPWHETRKAKRIETGEQVRMPDKLTWCTIASIRPDGKKLFMTLAEGGFANYDPDEPVVVRRWKVR